MRFEPLNEEDGQVERVHVEEARTPHVRRTILQREAAGLDCELGSYWSKASPRRLRRSNRVRNQTAHFIPSY